jgi:hypothetical protein
VPGGPGQLLTSVAARISGILTEPLKSRTGIRRERPLNRLGQVLAAIALLLQLALPGLHTPTPLGSNQESGTYSGVLDEHALCLAGNGGNTEIPSDRAPNPENHAFPDCCLWHAAAPGLIATATSAPVEFEQSEIVFAASARVVTGRLVRAFGARAPPVRA